MIKFHRSKSFHLLRNAWHLFDIFFGSEHRLECVINQFLIYKVCVQSVSSRSWILWMKAPMQETFWRINYCRYDEATSALLTEVRRISRVVKTSKMLWQLKENSSLGEKNFREEIFLFSEILLYAVNFMYRCLKIWLGLRNFLINGELIFFFVFVFYF